MIDAPTGPDGAAWDALISELRDWFARGEVEAPARQVLKMPQPDGSEASLLIMPSWVPGQAIGIKVVTFLPENAQAGLPVIHAGYMLFDGTSGALVSAGKADGLTARRTAAVSALGASYLARTDARRLLIVGTGQLSRFMAAAHARVRPYDTISIWGRNVDAADRVAGDLRHAGHPARAVTDLETTCREADVISTVTASTKPIVHGDWLRPGTHLDLVGAFREDMREADDQCLMQARLFVDDRDSAMRSGDLAQPVKVGLVDPLSIEADLADLCRRGHPGRTSDDDRTVFKSAGTALADLATAQMTPDQPD